MITELWYLPLIVTIRSLEGCPVECEWCDQSFYRFCLVELSLSLYSTVSNNFGVLAFPYVKQAVLRLLFACCQGLTWRETQRGRAFADLPQFGSHRIKRLNPI